VGLFVHDPVVVISVSPRVAVPLIAGATVFEGAGGSATVAVWAEVAELDPPALAAVTTTRMVWPMSSLARL
jgi:hypothetical protein